MIFLAAKVTNIISATREFLSRGLNSFTVGRIGDIGVFGKPLAHQLAYDGYKANIECFLTATATNKKISCSHECCPFPESYKSTVPLPLPRVVFTLVGTLSSEQITRFEQAYGTSGLEKLVVKDPHTYTLERPTPENIKKLSRGTKDRSISLDGYAQIKAVLHLLPIYGMIDSFLATHTYSFRSHDLYTEENLAEAYLTNAEIRAELLSYRTGYGEKTKYPKIGDSAATEARQRGTESTSKEDMTPWLSGKLKNRDPVYVAKPSGKPSKTSWGLPSEVPNKPGLLFPYFPGMLAEDTKAVRSAITSLFFRGLGNVMTSPKEAYLELRNIIGTATTTPQGIILSHVLKGFELGLDCQAQVYLLFDSGTYLGFCLLGEEFQVYFNGWHTPLNEEDLRKELETLYTHDQTLSALVSAFSRCRMDGSDMVKDYKAEEVVTCENICDILGSIDTEATAKADLENVTMLIKNLNFPIPYRKINKDNIVWAVQELGASSHDFSKERMFIHPTEWSEMGSDEYQILSCFGPQSISFIDPRGDNYPVPTDPKEFGYYEDAVAKKKRLPVYEKNLKTCISDWRQLEATGCVKLKLTERAIGSRAFVLTGENIMPVWNALRETARSFKVVVGKRAGGSKGKEPSKKPRTDEGKSFDEMF
jgi:hypothetical protein